MNKWITRADIALRSNKMVKRGLEKRGEIELSLLGVLTKPGQRSLDIGANKGVYTYQLRKHGPVTAFEPIPHLAEKIRVAAFRNVDIEHCAIGASGSRTCLSIPHHLRKAGTLNLAAATLRNLETDVGRDEIEVEVRTLDSYQFNKLGFIKVDAEGWEEHIIKGAEDTLARTRASLMVELVDYVAPGCLVDVPNQLNALGYEGFYIDHDTRKATSVLELNHENPQAQNFIFAPEAEARTLAETCTAALSY